MNLHSQLDKFVLHMQHKLVHAVQGFKARIFRRILSPSDGERYGVRGFCLIVRYMFHVAAPG